MPHKDFEKPYDHTAIESDIYELWEKSGNFAPQEDAKDTFCIIMPPPNANGSLHVGHAVGMTLEDVMIRYNRLKGKATLWLPGADHAGFETQVVFEKKLEKEDTSRFAILKEEGGREKLWQMIWDFTQENKANMQHQVKQLGASCDWNRETFTLDPEVVSVVYDTFKQLYEDGLIYRAQRIVHWCPKHQTTLSDLEVTYQEQKDPLYYIKYGPITLATVRLETKFGDTAIAVHPNDERYKQYVGKEIEIETIAGKTKIRVIADEAVDPDFGTGAVKVTPAHDPDDYAMWQRHKEEIPGPKEIIDQYGRMKLDEYFTDNPNVMKYHGMKIMEAREAIAKDMQEKGLMEKIDDTYDHSVACCYKCKNMLEPRLMDQWFIDLTSKKGREKIVQPAIDAVKKGDITIVPDFQEKTYFHWMENIRDWNISRQIVWGITIPVWYCKNQTRINNQPPSLDKEGNQDTSSKEKESFVISEEKPDKCPVCGECEMEQETDVFDTWFSSGQWPYATLLAQQERNNQQDTTSKDFERFYPTSVMETGYDILFFWVARMIMLGMYRTGKIPFETVYLHGLVRDKDKQKMSKSKGNVVDPMGIVQEYGADALRMALLVGNSPGQDASFNEQKVKGYRNFSNKLWNIARFITTHFEKGDTVLSATLQDEDKKLLEEFDQIQKSVEQDIEKYRFSQAAETAYHYVWHRLADELIEEKKGVLFDENADAAAQQSARKVLYELLMQSLVLLHPFMPFVTEAIYQRLPEKDKDFLMVENW